MQERKNSHADAASPRPDSQIPESAQRETVKIIMVDPKKYMDKPFLESHQILIASGLTFIIGFFTLFNAIISTYLNDKNRRDDLESKRLAFFSVLVSELDMAIEKIQRTKEILESIEIESIGSAGSVNAIRFASRNIDFNFISDNWDKLSNLKPKEIIDIRKLQIRVSEISSLFSSILDDPNLARIQGALPLFEIKYDGDKAQDEDRLELLFEDLLEATNEGLQDAQNLRIIVSKSLGEL